MWQGYQDATAVAEAIRNNQLSAVTAVKQAISTIKINNDSVNALTFLREEVAIQSGMIPIASANDGGNSIRIPALFSGLVDLKPTRGRTAMSP